MSDHPSSNLARNLRRLREARGLTQQTLAELSEVPRPTLAHLESGAANPTLSVLMKVAAALHASIEQLIAEPRRSVRHFPMESLELQRRGKVRVRNLLPEPIVGVRFDRIQLESGGCYVVRREAGTVRRVVVCEHGELECELEEGAEVACLVGGDVAIVDSETGFRLENRRRKTAVGFTLTAPAPTAR